MLDSRIKNGAKVYFGRTHGERTLGEVIKINPKSIKVKQLEARGTYPIGTVWSVAHNFVNFAGDATPSFDPTGKQATVSRLAGELASKVAWEAANGRPARPERIILQEITGVYGALSPENLSCDGELPLPLIRRREAMLRRQLKELFAELGHQVSESEAFGIVKT